MLTAYQQQTQRLLNDEAAQFFNIADLTVYINNARNDIVRQSSCVIISAALAYSGSTQSYALSSITAPTGCSTPISARSVRISTNVLEARPWQWFTNYYLNGSNASSSGTPTLWSQQSQGSTGLIWFWPTPSGSGSATVDASWGVIPLVTDSTAEAIPAPWTDLVPYFAAYQALLQAQRLQDASQMFALYNQFMRGMRLGVTPDWMPGNFPPLRPLQTGIDAGLSLAGPTAKPAGSGEGSVG